MVAVRVLGWSSVILDLFGHISTTHGEYLVVSITLQNLVMIDGVVSKYEPFHYLARVPGKLHSKISHKRLFTCPKLGFGGYLTPTLCCKKFVTNPKNKGIVLFGDFSQTISPRNVAMLLCCQQSTDNGR